MTKDELKQVLEVLQFNGNIWHMDCKKDVAIAAIEAALAQPAQQEPVASCNGMPAYEGPLSKALTQDLYATLRSKNT